jgi:DNA-binding response OmpR family regulator
VEDHDDLRDSLVELLSAKGHATIGFSCAEDLDDSPAMDVLELVLVDLNLPGEDGLALVGRLKRAYPGMRVIMMTSRTAVQDRVRGYDAGADIYLPKPIHEAELLAAVRALTRKPLAGGSNAPDAAPHALRVDTRALRLSGPVQASALSTGECALLAALARAPAQRLEYWKLMSVLELDLDASGGRAMLAVRMTRLRNKVVAVGGELDALKSVRGFGYQLCVPVEVS